MLQCYVAPACFEMGQASDGRYPYVPADGSKPRVAADGPRCDVTSSCFRSQIACDVFHGNVPATRLKMRRSTNVSGSYISAHCGKRCTTVQILNADIAAAGRGLYVVIRRHIHIHRYPEASTA